ncbi:MAG: hypothetical protein IH583_12795, partial [Candidatus Aminicenantes bacterium]|nr:hypothetical protein [Candidatus Aminicenantes bacterium]
MTSKTWSRRTFLRTAGAFGTAALAFDPKRIARVEAATQSVANMTPEEVAKD